MPVPTNLRFASSLSVSSMLRTLPFSSCSDSFLRSKSKWISLLCSCSLSVRTRLWSWYTADVCTTRQCKVTWTNDSAILIMKMPEPPVDSILTSVQNIYVSVTSFTSAVCKVHHDLLEFFIQTVVVELRKWQGLSSWNILHFSCTSFLWVQKLFLNLAYNLHMGTLLSVIMIMSWIFEISINKSHHTLTILVVLLTTSK